MLPPGLVQSIAGGIHTFSMSINPKGKVITRLEFELACCDVTVRHVCHYATETLQVNFLLGPKYQNFCPVSWGSRLHRLHLCRGGNDSLNKCPVYDTKQSDCEASVMLGLWGMQSTPSLPSFQVHSGSVW